MSLKKNAQSNVVPFPSQWLRCPVIVIFWWKPIILRLVPEEKYKKMNTHPAVE
jgi:hypothetical protein